MAENTEPISNATRLWQVMKPLFGGERIVVDDALIDGLVERIATITGPAVSGALLGGASAELTYDDLDGLGVAWKEWLGAFTRIRFEFEAVEERGENVLVLVRQVGTTRHGVELVQPSAAVFKFRDELLTVIEFHLDRAAAGESVARPA